MRDLRIVVRNARKANGNTHGHRPHALIYDADERKRISRATGRCPTNEARGIIIWRRHANTAVEARILANAEMKRLLGGAEPTPPPTFPAPPVDLGVTKHRERAPKQSTGKAFVDSKHDLYDVDLFDPLTGAFIRRKVGITATGDSRYQGTAATFGLGFRYRQKGTTYANKAAALEAEDRLIASIRKDPSWQQVAKECFAKAVSE